MEEKNKLVWYKQQKYFDKPWKVFLWITVLYRFIQYLVKAFFKLVLRPSGFEPTEGTLFLLYVFSFIAFILAIIITGNLYKNSMHKPIEKKTRLKVAIYVSVYALVINTFVFLVAGTIMGSGIVDLITSVGLSFLLVYFILKWTTKTKK